MKRTIIGSVALAVVAAGVSIGLAAGAGATPHKRTMPVAPFSTRVKVPPARYFGVLRHGIRHAALSQQQSNELDRAVNGSSGIRYLYAPDAAQAVALPVQTLSPARHAYLIPGQGAACLYVPDSTGYGGMGCERTQVAQLGYLMGVQYTDPAHPTVVGVAPDGVSSVTAIAADGSSQTVPVSENSYEVRMPNLRILEVGSHTIHIPAVSPPPALP